LGDGFAIGRNKDRRGREEDKFKPPSCNATCGDGRLEVNGDGCSCANKLEGNLADD